MPWGRCTAKPGKLYLHVFEWPKDGKLEVSSLKDTVTKAYLLVDKDKAKLPTTRKGEDNIVVTIPSEAPDKIDTVIVLEIKDK